MRSCAALFCLVSWFGPAGLFAESKPLELKWTELAPLIAGHTVEVILTDGLGIHGEAVAVREDTLLMDVKRAAKGYAKGNAVIPRQSVNLIKLQRTRGAYGRSIGTVLGVLSGITLGSYAAIHTDSAGAGIPVFLGISGATSVAGYYAGRGLDRRTTTIRIVP